jgi:CRP-like cAMP-binding protein
MRWTGNSGRDRKVDEISRVPMLRAAGRAELARLALSAEMVEVKPGDPIQVEGVAARWFYLILSGDVVFTRNGRILGHSGAGTTIGEADLLAGTEPCDSVAAVSTVRALVIGKRQFGLVLEDCPVFRDGILRSLSRQLVAATKPLSQPVLLPAG